jgi:molecular chaperone DnaK (HSP70)
MPQVMARITEQYTVPVKMFDPDEAVAKGAAIFAERHAFFSELMEKAAAETGRTQEQVQRDFDAGKEDVKTLAKKAKIADSEALDLANMNVGITNVTSRSFGTIAYQSIESEDSAEVLYNLIVKNTELPASEIKQFFTVVPDQKYVTIRVLESLSPERFAQPSEGTEIGETILELPTGLPAGSPLEIEFKLNSAGCLELHAVETTGNREINARFETVDAISPTALAEAKRRMEDAMVL